MCQITCQSFALADSAHIQTIPHHTGIGPDEWFYWLGVVMVESCPSGKLP